MSEQTRPGADAVVADLERRPPRKVRLGGLELLLGVPLMVFAAVVLVGGTFYLLVYAISGPSVPGLINQGDAEGPAPVGERLQAAAYGVPFLAILAYLTWRAARARLSTPKVAIDSRGVWLLIGGRIAQGLEWTQIAAVNLVGPGGATTIPPTAAVPPLVEVFPVERIRDRKPPKSSLPHAEGHLGGRVIDAPPAAPGLTGKRYVLELATPALDDLATAIDHFAAHRRLPQ
ncbi:hypothetical protein GCM10010402_79570 [Actinomadura luteofluorescens]|uniref:hypothetical protein n=1 Tax=Actinomadura luteofluorescens TaxID=46163 RepID=UPI002164726A|nr:hypothetical protein [Actinomadura glauciflava]MCR3741919.1 hypothetical protein [Actinomadura glauciflava]